MNHVLKIEIFFLFQTPFNFGMNHRTPPYPAGDYCLLCRSERKDSSFLESGIKTASKLALSMAPKGNSVLHLPLWVCPDCRRTVEKEERHSGLDQPSVSVHHGQHGLLSFLTRWANWAVRSLIWVNFLEGNPSYATFGSLAPPSGAILLVSCPYLQQVVGETCSPWWHNSVSKLRRPEDVFGLVSGFLWQDSLLKSSKSLWF